ncbi:cupin domain-containing protein [Gilvimarinus sp. F26214L]|uniref:cupin domain-containing protein n=1 Tax=Gilvimarinus sp. DZF01 TaxID=3461371 RepID=UPI00404571F8
MSDTFKPVLSLNGIAYEPFKHGERYESRDAYLSEPLKLTQIGAVCTEVPPGKSACPFHVHRVEDEMFVILEGRGEYRFGNHSYPVTAGDVLGAPRGGPEYAHQLTNTGDTVLRYLALSSKAETEVCEYPDSGKFLVMNKRDGKRKFDFVGYLKDRRDYWDGEE